MLQVFALSLTLAANSVTTTATQGCWNDWGVSQGRGSGRTVFDNGLERRWPANAECANHFQTLDGLWEIFWSSPELKAWMQSDEVYDYQEAMRRYSWGHCSADDLTAEETARCQRLKEEADASEQELCDSDVNRALKQRPELEQIATEFRAAEQLDCYLPRDTSLWPE